MNDMVRIGLYGDNGHQLPANGATCGKAGTVICYAGLTKEPDLSADLRRHESLEAMLEDPEVDLVSLCSPRRADQADDAIRCMQAGKHVLAEKPCAMSERDLNRIIETATTTGLVFHEMAPTVVEEPYATMRSVVADGSIGEVVQVYAQKSYPWHQGRPQDEAIDGGLLRQAGIYLYRFVEHIAGIPVVRTDAWETTLGNHGPDSECRRAVSVMMRLENGGIASGIANYCAPPPEDWGQWGYETLRIYGTAGFVESINHGEVLRLVTTGGGIRNFTPGTGAPGFTERVLLHVAGRRAPDLGIEEELHPTRMVNQAKARADAAGA